MDIISATDRDMECLRNPSTTVGRFGLLLLIFFSSVHALVKTNGSQAVAPAAQLQVSLVRASDTFVELGWAANASLSSCELAYGPMADTNQVEVLSNFLPRGPTFTVGGLQCNSSYHFHMVCYFGNGTERVASNILRFTTGASGSEGGNPHPGDRSPQWSPDPYKGSYHAVFKQTILRDGDGVRGVPSFNVLLGAVAGIVGFLIINVTVVIAVRRCSHRRMRRRRILVLEDRDNDDFHYARAYN
ncbi:uncharacterized protein LOC135390915 [Ornithodoros turicata]|uniref:uncharacterized protein LOC135390915 n=1 Tax=Ornithodoros turicata TaxID=34597 RepID=UPI0031393D83